MAVRLQDGREPWLVLVQHHFGHRTDHVVNVTLALHLQLAGHRNVEFDRRHRFVQRPGRPRRRRPEHASVAQLKRPGKRRLFVSRNNHHDKYTTERLTVYVDKYGFV